MRLFAMPIWGSFFEKSQFVSLVSHRTKIIPPWWAWRPSVVSRRNRLLALPQNMVGKLCQNMSPAFLIESDLVFHWYMCFCSRCQYIKKIYICCPTVLGFIPHVDILTEIFPLSGHQGPSVFGWTCAHFGLFTLDNGGRPDLEREENLERFNWVQLAFLNGIR
jgi:hypothetical protein